MFDWLRRRRRLSPEAGKRLLLVAARSEESLIEAHVTNLLDLIEALDGEVDLERAIEIYSEMVTLEESRAPIVANRLLARLEKPDGSRPSRTGKFQNVFRDERPR